MRRFAMLVGLAIATAAALTANAADFPELHPTDAQQVTATLVYGLLADKRYSLRPLAADAFPAVLDTYLRALDEDRVFLTKADVEAMTPLRARSIGSLRDHDLEPAFEIFRKYRQRIAARAALVPALVAATKDFSARESLSLSHDRWLDSAELDEQWRLQVKSDLLELRLAGVPLARAGEIVSKRYADVAERVGELTASDIVESYFNAFAQTADRGNSYYAPPDTARLLRAMSKKPGQVGVGMSVQRIGAYPIVAAIVPGGPAARSGKVHDGDRILAVGDGDDLADVIGWRIDDVVDRMRGIANTPMRMRLKDASGAVREVEIERAPVQLFDEAAKAETEVVGQNKVEVIRVPSFYFDFEASRRGDPDARSAAADVRRLLSAARGKGARAVVLDLRGNGGGSLNEAVSMASLFLGKQAVVQIRENGGKTSVEAGKEDALWTGPLVVIVDEQSAAASEIVAASLQDAHRAVVVGQRSFGKGSVQNLIDLDRWPDKAERKFGQVKLTIADLARPSGAGIAAAVAPDVVLDEPLPPTSPGRDPDAVLGPVAGFSPGAPIDMTPLRAAVGDMRRDPDFARWLAARDIQRLDRQARLISLNEADRRAESARRGPITAAGWLPEVRDAPLRIALKLAAAQAKVGAGNPSQNF